MAAASSIQPCIDPLLEPFVRCTDERRAMAHLERIIRRHAEPVIQKAVQHKTPSNIDDATDLHSEMVSLLVKKLNAVRNHSDIPIRDFLAFTRFTVRRLYFNYHVSARVQRHFDSLETGVVCGFEDRDTIADICALVEQRSLLQMVWTEILALPTSQRLALLYNFRDRDGSNALPLLACCQIASPAELARTFNIAEADIDTFVDSLPMNDMQIGAMLGLTQQEVSNQRSIGRRRLQRRIEKWLR